MTVSQEVAPSRIAFWIHFSVPSLLDAFEATTNSNGASFERSWQVVEPPAMVGRCPLFWVALYGTQLYPSQPLAWSRAVGDVPFGERSLEATIALVLLPEAGLSMVSRRVN
jgi:hypothetical protein